MGLTCRIMPRRDPGFSTSSAFGEFLTEESPTAKRDQLWVQVYNTVPLNKHAT